MVVISKVIGITVVFLIIVSIAVQIYEHISTETPWKISQFVLIGILVVWGLGILLDVIYHRGYKFTIARGVHVYA